MSDGEIRRHGPLLPNTIRCIICGSSNCGKTNALISLIESPHGVRFENLTQDEEVFETGDNPSLETSVRQAVDTSQGRQRLQGQLGPLGVYVNTLLIGNARNKVDLVYGVYFDENGTMLGNKKFDVDTDDTIQSALVTVNVVNGNRSLLSTSFACYCQLFVSYF
ncbi:hypothetical protein ALC57_17910 [Trachymyrmex cornetzi]|uniref:Uncharacterized protein n=1 Tax=Trachymyrmex cornetzi TaxID=471704 RepID=A0A151ISW5_9HYME|nr:hypothetical protein ALC57_17910 [Trachymyrmex cornetzi]